MSGTQEPFDLHGSQADDETARLLRRALEREATAMHPSEDGLDRITERTRRSGRRAWGPWAAAAAAAVVVAAVVTSTAVGDGSDAVPAASGTTSQATLAQPSTPAADPTQEPKRTQEPTGTDPVVAPSPQTAGTEGTEQAPSSDQPEATTGARLSGIPVYWVGQTQTSYRLFREFRSVPDVGGRVASAVAAMTSLDPADPDYTSPWAPASQVEASVEGDEIVVDISADAFATGVGSELAELAVQQLVYTATAAAQVPGPVTITVAGEPYDAWGTVPLGEPMRRSPAVDVQNPTWVLSPVQGAVVDTGTVEFTGYGTAFEGTFAWEVRDADGTVVADGVATGGSMGTFGDLSFTADLAPGEYTVEVWAPDVSDGESPQGPRMFPDSKAFTVR